MAFDKEHALATLKDLGLPIVFEDIWMKRGPSSLEWQFEAPVHYFQLGSEVDVMCPRMSTCCPLLESNGSRLLAYDLKEHEFVEYYYGDSECTTIGKTYQQFLTYIFVDLGFADLMNIVEDVAPLFKYLHLNELREFMDAATPETAAQAQSRFVASIPD